MVSRVMCDVTVTNTILSCWREVQTKVITDCGQSFTHNSGTLQVPPKLSHSRVCVPQLDKGGKIDYLCIF